DITVREVDAGAADRARAIVERLSETGSPNWFGPQRFGRFGTNAFDGWRIVRGEKVPGAHRLKRFFVSSLQSLLFNRWLAERIQAGTYQRVVEGDWARKHDTGGTFLVEDEEAESLRASRLEISTTFPLYGRKVKSSPGAAGEREAAALDDLGLTWRSEERRVGKECTSRWTTSQSE